MSTTYGLSEDAVSVMRKTLEHVVGNLDEWKQRYWVGGDATSSCRTTFCFAGHAAVTVAGAQQVTSGSSNVWVNGAQRHVADHARLLLGLTDPQADNLFRATNGLRRLAELCYLYSDGRVDLLDALPAATSNDRAVEREQRVDAEADLRDLRLQARHRDVDLATLLRKIERRTPQPRDAADR